LLVRDRRIALITPGFSADDSDWCIPAVRNLVGELVRRTDVRVLALHYPYREGSYAAAGASVHALGGANVRGVRRASLLLSALRWVLAEHRRRPIDLLHGLWADEGGAVAVAAARLLRVPAVVSLMGGELLALRDIGYGAGLSRLGRRLVSASVRNSARVTVGSSQLERLAAPRVPAARLVLLPLGVDATLFHPDGRATGPALLQSGEVRLLSVGSLTAVKDQATLLAAFEIVVGRIPGAHLHVVGDGPLRRELELRAEALGVTPRVSFHGAVAHDRLPALYRAADVLVVSSRYESQCMSALEAAACGCAVVGTAVGMLPDLPGASVVSVGKSAALAEAVIAAVSEPEALASRARANLEAVHAEFALERMVDRLCSLYHEVLAA
jgi:glycosyltransferase involved in cell wall biosynthesis